MNIEALISYRDPKYEKHVETMRPKEVHCVCPFLRGKKMSRHEFLELSETGHHAETGLNFRGVDAGQITSFLEQTCKIRHYKVDNFSVDGGKMLYLSSESIGEKAYYLLTALVSEEDGLTRVMLRAVSDKPHGLNGFLNETVTDLRHVVSTVYSAREIGVIRKEQVINIIDSVVQRTSFGGGEGASSINIRDSVVQRTEFNAVDEERRGRDEERIRKERKEEELRKKEEEHREKERLRREEEKAKVPETTTNSIGMKFTLIPAGDFMMGSDEYNAEKPVHKVTIKKPFYLGTYPVTQKEWKAVMGDNPSYFKGDDLPVEQVSWDDVQDFIKKLNEKEGGNKYRLPSEAEWEYAARAGTTTPYSFGNSESSLGDYAWYSENSGSRPPKKGDYAGYDKIDWLENKWSGKTHDVAQKKPNPWGLYDMHGNVWEWVQDWYHNDYKGAPTDGSAWESGSGSYRVSRGGSWSRNARACRSAVRGGFDPGSRGGDVGFRLLQEP